jgi:hypothetical protein
MRECIQIDGQEYYFVFQTTARQTMHQITVMVTFDNLPFYVYKLGIDHTFLKEHPMCKDDVLLHQLGKEFVVDMIKTKDTSRSSGLIKGGNPTLRLDWRTLPPIPELELK